MEYFYCPDCESFMDENEALCFTPEVHTELDEKPVEWVSNLRCIYCNGEHLEDAGECEECGELFRSSELDENGLCPDCREEKDNDS